MADKAKKNTVEKDQATVDAVEGALSIDYGDSAEPDQIDLSDLEKSIADAADQLLEGDDGSQRDRATVPDTEVDFSDELPITPPLAANDEYNEELNDLLYEFQQSPRSRAGLWATLFSLVWLATCGVYAYYNQFLDSQQSLSLESLLSSTQFLSFAAIALLPLIGIWTFAAILRRSLEMRHAASNLTRAALRLLQPEKVASDAAANVGVAIRREMNAIGDGVERAIARAGELEFMVQKEVMELERAYGDSEVKLQRLVTDIGNERREVVSHAEQLRAAIAQSQAGLSSEIDLANGRIEETLRSVGSSVIDSLENQSVTVSSRLQSTSDELMGLLSKTNDEISSNLGTGREKLSEDITNHTREMANLFSTSGEALATLMDRRTASFGDVVKDVTSKLDTSQKAFELAFGEKTKELHSAISTVGQSVTSQLASGTAELNEQAEKLSREIEDNLGLRASEFESRVGDAAISIDQKLSENLDAVSERLTTVGESYATSLQEANEGLVSSLSASSENLVAALGMRTEVLGKVLQDRTSAMGDTIANRLSGFGQSLTGHIDNAVSHMKEQTDALEKSSTMVEEVVVKRTQQVEDAIKQSTIEFAKGLEDNIAATKERSDAVNAALTNAADSLDQTVNANLERLGATFETSSSSLLETLEQGNTRISDTAKLADQAIGKTIENASENIRSTLSESVGQFVETAKSTEGSIGNQLTEANNAIAENIAKGTQAIKDSLSERAANLAKAVEDGTANFASMAEAKSDEIGSRIQEGTQQLSDAVANKANEAANQMEGHVAALEARLEENSGSIDKQFAAGMMVLNERLGEGQENFIGEISKAIEASGNALDNKAEKISALLSSRAELIQRTLGTTLVDTQRSIESKTEELNALMAERTSELSGILQNEAAPLFTSIEQVNAGIKSGLVDALGAIEEQSNLLFSRLADTNADLNGLINTAGENLNLLGQNLAEHQAKYENTVQTSKAQLDEANQTAREVEDKLQGTSANLLQNMASIASRLEAQGNLLQDAVRLIDAAQNGFEATLGSRKDVLDELSTGLVSRTEQINSSVVSFAETINSMMDTLHRETGKTSSGLSTELASAIDDATARFSDSVDAMRGAAATIRSELDATREEMRRGVLELPEETAQSASAMRRVVTDQIAALRDLSSIVERSGKMLDARPAAARQETAAPRSAPAPAISAPQAPRDLPPLPPREAPQARSRQQFPPDTQPVREAPRAREDSFRAPPPPPRQPAEPLRQSDRSGWVSELLRRASSDDEPTRRAPAPQPDPRSPDQFVESLNSLSMDIASAIDHNASVDLWERYQAGETNVFTRRLYTLQGQQTFDEIHRKYGSEADFREAVDRYIDDFERLLADVSRNDLNGKTAQRYLTSDTGKVYTMLAHAAGRFGRV